MIAEGAGIVLLEEREAALARGARILCELAGYGSSSDAGHINYVVDDLAGFLAAAVEAEREARR